MNRKTAPSLSASPGRNIEQVTVRSLRKMAEAMRFEPSNIAHVLGSVVLLLLILIRAAHAGDLTVTDAWIRALPRSVPSAGYFSIRNGGSKDIVLTGAESASCGMLMLHKTENHDGMDSMAHMIEVNVPAGKTVRFAPGGYHLMCMEAGPAIQPGRIVPITLKFKDGTRLAAAFAVRSATGK